MSLLAVAAFIVAGVPSTGAAVRVVAEDQRRRAGGRWRVARVVRLDARLLEDDLALALDLLGIERRAEGHVGEQLDGGLDRVRRHDDVVVRVVERGDGVGAAADALDGAVDVAGPELVGALEQHVLLEVRVAEPVGPPRSRTPVPTHR